MLLKKLFCNHNNITFVRSLTNFEIEKQLKKNKACNYLYRCNKCGKLIYK